MMNLFKMLNYFIKNHYNKISLFLLLIIKYILILEIISNLHLFLKLINNYKEFHVRDQVKFFTG